MHKSMKLKVFVVLLLAVACLAVICKDLATPKEEPVIGTIVTDSIPAVDEQPDFMSKSSQEGLMEALVYYEVDPPEIVYAQAVLETGWFTSSLCLNSHNLFGLYNSKKMRYYKFNHWAESVVAYIKFVQYKYKPPDDYYEFLSRIGYAEDKDYIRKLRNITNKLQDDKRRYIRGDTISPRF